MFQRLLAVTMAGLFLLSIACGGTSRRVLVEPRRDSYDALFEALAQVSTQRGLSPRPRRGGMTVLVDREAGTRITYTARRNGVVMTVGIRDEEDETVPESSQIVGAELERVETLGRELMDEARRLAVALEAQRAEEERARAIAEQQERERRAIVEAQQREEDERRRAELEAMMAGQRERQARMRASSTDSSSSAGTSTGASASTGARCCINGAYYECPGAAEVDRCVGAFTRCVSGCGLSCMEQCMQTHPPDPSGCVRVPANDGSC